MNMNVNNRIFLIAIAISLVWHLFCISSVQIVTPKAASPVKFSRVSFLGPLLERGAIELRLEPKERSFLEKRHLEAVENMHYTGTGDAKNRSIAYVREETPLFLDREKLPYLVREAVSGPKPEPVYISD